MEQVVSHIVNRQLQKNILASLKGLVFMNNVTILFGRAIYLFIDTLFR